MNHRDSEAFVALAVDGTRLSEKAMVRRQRIIGAAIELATGGGYEAVHMRNVAERAEVALATVYRYFESKDHLLSQAVSDWTAQLQTALARTPARGDTAADRLVDVLRRATRALERRPLLTSALVRALGSTDPSVSVAAATVRSQISAIAMPILEPLGTETSQDIVAVLAHVWNSSLIAWASGHQPIGAVGNELERAARLLLADRL